MDKNEVAAQIRKDLRKVKTRTFKEVSARLRDFIAQNMDDVEVVKVGDQEVIRFKVVE